MAPDSDLSLADNEGHTALHVLVQNAQSENLSIWLESGGDKWCFSRLGSETASALDYAIEERKWSIATQLVKAGTNQYSHDSSSKDLLEVLNKEMLQLEAKIDPYDKSFFNKYHLT